MKKELVNEIVWLRAIACMTVVFGHSIQSGFEYYFTPGTPPSTVQNLLFLLLMAAFFATPAFVFLSEFLISKRYPFSVPKGFLRKRAKFLFIPYVFTGIIYALIETPKFTLQSILIESLKNIFLGDFTVYFIIIIFQFYVLHVLFSKKLSEWSPKIVLPITLVINLLYLAFFNFIDPPNDAISTYIWKTGHWIPFLGWIFYFSLGYYCGKYHAELLVLLKKYNVLITGLTVVTFLIIVINKYFGVIEAISSKRVDILLYTTCIIFLIMYISSMVNRSPRFFIFIGNYSFSIYLLHKIFLHFMRPIFNINISTYIIVAFLLSISCSTIISYIFNLSAFGKYLVGQNKLIKQNKLSKSKEVQIPKAM